jgi:hypothetical protein
MMGVCGTGCGVFFLFKIHTIMIAPMMIATRPPTAPPTIAGISDGLDTTVAIELDVIVEVDDVELDVIVEVSVVELDVIVEVGVVELDVGVLTLHVYV